MGSPGEVDHSVFDKVIKLQIAICWFPFIEPNQTQFCRSLSKRLADAERSASSLQPLKSEEGRNSPPYLLQLAP